jgi:aspartate/methionine/tyrosine aminotransferase
MYLHTCSAYVKLVGGEPVSYYADENADWEINLGELHKIMCQLRKSNMQPKAMVIINPGNPTGHVLSYDNLAGIVRFCHSHG